ncbi:MAG: hypothetical protein Q9162_001665 [Coniocarpon cinnabarinum]
MTPRLRIDGTVFRDSRNREVILHGINVAGDAKLPAHPPQPSHEPSRFLEAAQEVSFVDRPFTLQDAPTHFSRLRKWGYNSIRYIFTWEALEHAGPGIYDEDFISFTISTLRIAKRYGFYVWMDPHQDVWSRFTGGSGAPLWTVYACGLDPTKFSATEAALVQNLWPDPSKFPKMIWATNYTRLACQTLFSLFFGGRDFAPKAIINGMNIQDFLQEHFIGACAHLATRIKEAVDLDSVCISGWESVNEPHRGLIGRQDISIIPRSQQLQKGTSPTPWQAMLTGSGRAQEEITWEFGSLGPYKSGSQLIDPQGQSVWLSDTAFDEIYGFKRDSQWQLGTCLWAQHSVWDPSTDTLLRPDHFARDPNTGDTINYEYFTNHYFMSYYRRYRNAIRAIFPATILFCQPPVLEIPPTLKGTDDDDPNMVYSPHWYDGVTLMTKKWNSLWNVDVFGILRGRYLTPAFGVKVGEKAIRNCFRDQWSAIRKEGLDYMGLHPCVFTEFGIPYDMDDGHAYKTGDYASQIAAMDANHFAAEGAKVGFALWNYASGNSHTWGDQWNGEDLSVLSLDDGVAEDERGDELQVDGSPGPKQNMRVTGQEASSDASAATARGQEALPGTTRAARAFVRPAPVATHGSIVDYGFDLKTVTFTLNVLASTSAPQDAPTEVFLPNLHFPDEGFETEVSDGETQITGGEFGGKVLKWWNTDGQQSLKVRNAHVVVEEERCGGESGCRAM